MFLVLARSWLQNIVNYRNEHGAFKHRRELKKVPRLGDKAFEQAAGFLTNQKCGSMHWIRVLFTRSVMLWWARWRETSIAA